MTAERRKVVTIHLPVPLNEVAMLLRAAARIWPGATAASAPADPQTLEVFAEVREP